MTDPGAPISGESFFDPLPQEYVSIGNSSSLDNSIIWHLNSLFWKHFELWQETYGEHYEASLPSGVSESHRESFISKSADRFITLLNNLERYGDLPAVIYVLEQGPGTGQYALGFLDRLQSYSQRNDKVFYDRLQYLLVDTSGAILNSALSNLSQHKNHVSSITDTDPYSEKILMVRHGNLWDQLPVKILTSSEGALSELQVEPVLDKVLESELSKLKTSFSIEQVVAALKNQTIESLILTEPKLWKPLVRALYLKSVFKPLPKEYPSTEPFSGVLQQLAKEHIGQEFVYNVGALADIEHTTSLIDWNRGGYMELVDIVLPAIDSFNTKRRPKKYDGSLGSFINGPMLNIYAKQQSKHITFEKIRGLNHTITIRQHSLEALLKGGRFITIAEVAASKNNTLEETLGQAQTLLEEGIDIIAFSDQALVKQEFFKLSDLANLGLFKLLPSGATLPILKTRTKDQESVRRVTKELLIQRVKSLFVVTGDSSNESVSQLQSSLDVIPSVSPLFFCGAVAHPASTDITKTQAKIKAGAQFLIMQSTYDQLEWEEWVRAVKDHRIPSQVPLLAVVMPVISHRTLEVVQKIEDINVPASFVEQFQGLSNEQVRIMGIEIAKSSIARYKSSGIYSGIYIYCRSREVTVELKDFIRSLDDPTASPPSA